MELKSNLHIENVLHFEDNHVNEKLCFLWDVDLNHLLWAKWLNWSNIFLGRLKSRMWRRLELKNWKRPSPTYSERGLISFKGQSKGEKRRVREGRFEFWTRRKENFLSRSPLNPVGSLALSFPFLSSTDSSFKHQDQPLCFGFTWLALWVNVDVEGLVIKWHQRFNLYFMPPLRLSQESASPPQLSD